MADIIWDAGPSIRVLSIFSNVCQLFLMFPWIVQFRLQNPFYPLFFLIAVTFISLSYVSRSKLMAELIA